MTRRFSAPLAGATFIALTALLAACGTGGGGGSTIPGGGGGGGGGPTPTTSPSVAPTQTPTVAPSPPNITGGLSIPGISMANALVAFTCGCSQQAGQTHADANGNYTVTPVSSAIPASPSPTYTTVPGRNYMLIGYSPTNHAQTWTMTFLGLTSSHNLSISNNSGSTDPYSTLASLFIFANSPNNNNVSYDGWNFNTIQTWVSTMRSGTTSAQERQLISDIAASQAAGNALYPTVPVWNPDHGATFNPTIAADIRAITPATDPLVPTPCPSGLQSNCTGAPQP